MFLLHPKNDINISVIITNHKYEEYLKECIQSVLEQTSQATEIIIIDDKPTNDLAKTITQQFDQHLQYYRVNYGDPLKSREYGFNKSTSDFIMFLDADDILDKLYIYGAANIIANNKDIDIVYSDIRHFEDDQTTKITNFNQNIPPKRMAQVPFMHVGCITRREIIIAADAFNHHRENNYDNYHEDWYYWRKILQTGCKYVKQNTPYMARSHNKNRSTKLLNKTDKYHILRGTEISTITYASIINKPVDDLYCIKDWDESIKGNCDRQHIQLFGNQNFNLIETPRNITWHTYTDKLKVINYLSKSISTDYVFFYDENNRPEIGIIRRMMNELSPEIAVVHDSRFKIFECTLIVSEVFKDYYYSDEDKIYFNEMKEKIIKI